MEFGIYLNQYGDERFEFGMEDLLAQTREIEALGYDTAAVGERHFYDEGFYDAFSCLSAMAATVEDVDLMTNILILPIYHPVHLAERMSAVDRMMDGGTRWGVSLGYRRSELVNFGVEMEERVPRFMEGLAVLKRLLAGERFDHDGEQFSFEDGFVAPTPVQEPRPPILGGGNADVAIKRAANRCDGFTAAVTVPEELEQDVELYYDTLAEVGKDPEDGHVTIMVDGYVGESAESAREALDPYVLDLTQKYLEWGNPEFDGRPSFSDIEAQTMIGSPAEVAEMVAEYRDIGVDHLIFRTQFPGMDSEVAMESVRRFADEVVPQFR
jgi:alkanesulfonate monooxygenase SsuD/methylene tetrahydromethanopterin reductase-like flavin-dependent oxidoreductase (luciferase family)